MGVVYEARHRNGKRVAIKLLHPELMVHSDVLKRFLREGYLANAVEHPGVVSVLDDGVTDDGLPYMVMEFLEGENLDARLTRLGRPLALPDVLAIGVAMLDVLELTHSRGVIHRDIKPENVFLTSTGGVKLLDFGIAYLLDTGGGGMSTTRPGVAVGTPTFMPREQAQGLGGKVDGQSDLWSVGATLYFALTTEFLYAASSVSEFVAQLVEAEPRPIRSLVPAIPEPIAEVIHRALQHDRARRWQTAGEMRKALLAAAKEIGVEIPPFPSPEGYASPMLRASLANLNEELEASLNERLSLPFPKPISSNPPPSSHRTPPTGMDRLSPSTGTPRVSVSAETLPGIPTPAGSGHQEEPPLPSLRITPPSTSSIHPPLSSPASRRHRFPLVVAALLGVGLVGLFWNRNDAPRTTVEVARTTEVSVPSVPPSSAANLPSVVAIPSAVPVASVAPSTSASAAPRTPAAPRANPARPAAPSKPAEPPGGDDLGAYRN
jgi:serine/threonine-protein kinase